MGDLLTFSLGTRRGLRRGTRAQDWYERGCALETTDPTAASLAYGRAIAGSPTSPTGGDAHNNLGRLHHDRGDLAEAESCYRLAICCGPKVALYWFNLGVVVEDRGRAAEALAAYEQAIALATKSGAASVAADAHFNIARLLELRGRRINDDLLLRRAVRHLVRYRDLSARWDTVRR